VTPPGCSGDVDCDGVVDAQDNCRSTPNAGQENNNGEIVDLPASFGFDDATNPAAVLLGDACNPDLDNDDLTAAEEATAGTDPANRDSDGDRQLDGAEAACGSNPLSAASTVSGPDSDSDGLPNACEAIAGSNAGLVDTDGDGVNDGAEFLRLGVNPADSDTDDDGCADGPEVASVNGDRVTNSLDLLGVALRFGPSSNPGYHAVFDMNRDGDVNSIDLQFVATQFGPCHP
jgi:hypothetical protein